MNEPIPQPQSDIPQKLHDIIVGQLQPLFLPGAKISLVVSVPDGDLVFSNTEDWSEIAAAAERAKARAMGAEVETRGKAATH